MKKTLLYLLLTPIVLFALLAALSAIAFLTKDLNSDYKLVGVWGGRGDEPGKFVYPAGLKIYNDEVYVVDVNSHKIQVFDLDGNYRREFGKEGEALGEFKRPWNIYFHGGELYVAAYENNRIDVFDPNGTFKRSFGSLGTGDGEIVGGLRVTPRRAHEQLRFMISALYPATATTPRRRGSRG